MKHYLITATTTDGCHEYRSNVLTRADSEDGAMDEANRANLKQEGQDIFDHKDNKFGFADCETATTINYAREITAEEYAILNRLGVAWEL